MSGAPLVVDDKVIVLPGGGSGKSVVAYNAADGAVAWQSQSDKAGYASAQIEMLAGERQIVVFSGKRAFGLAPDDGRLLWAHPWPTSYDINSAQPVRIDDDRLLISTEYGVGAALLQIQRDGDDFSARELWKKNTLKNKFQSSVLHEGHVYGFDGSILASIDPMTGNRNWKGGRYGFGQLLLAQGHLIVLTETGEVVLVKATPEAHEELARFQALEGKTWNVPAIADGILLVRNQTEMAAYQLQ
ncbi:MAG: PQQ-binding-like beta-propeller repeat protein [Acidobacteriota bacterium]